jgi:hypothetical protein
VAAMTRCISLVIPAHNHAAIMLVSIVGMGPIVLMLGVVSEYL